MQNLEIGTLLRAMDLARRSWDRDDVIDYAHGVAHYLAQDEVVLTLDGRALNPSALSLEGWRRLVRRSFPDFTPADRASGA